MELLKFDENIYAHKLNAQELGYRKGEPGKAGRYFYISKTYVGYFPHLSEVVTNDHIILDLIPPHTDEVVLTKFVYHNDKLNTEEGTRDEYRIYLNSRNDPGRNYYQPGDIVLIVKIRQDQDTFYKVIHIKPSSKEYEKVLELIEKADPRWKTHALLPLGQLTFVDGLRKINIGEKVIPDEIINEALAEPVIHAPVSEEDKYDTTRIIRSRSFRDLVLYFYNYKCAVTNQDLLIFHKDFNNLEAAHILARASGGGSHPSNGMALERNLHWAFDKGFFTVNFDGKDYYMEVHKDAMKIPYLASKNGGKLWVPEDSRSRPNVDSLKWHKDNVFGLFLKTEI